MASISKRERMIALNAAQLSFILSFDDPEPADLAFLDRTSKPKSIEQRRKVDFTDDDVAKLHRSLLEQSLHVLKDERAGDAVKKDVMLWVESDDVTPFSFSVCCVHAEVNHLKLRDSLRDLIWRSEKKQAKIQ